MSGRFTGSLATTLGFAVVATAGAFLLAAIAVTPGHHVRTVAAILLGPVAGQPGVLTAAEPEDEPATTGAVVWQLRRGV